MKCLATKKSSVVCGEILEEASCGLLKNTVTVTANFFVEKSSYVIIFRRQFQLLLKQQQSLAQLNEMFLPCFLNNFLLILHFQYSTPVASETVTNFTAAEAKCTQWGARLFQPRSTQAITYFTQAETNHMTEDMFRFSPSAPSSHLAIGLYYLQQPGDSQPNLYYRFVVFPFIHLRIVINHSHIIEIFI